MNHQVFQDKSGDVILLLICKKERVTQTSGEWFDQYPVKASNPASAPGSGTFSGRSAGQGCFFASESVFFGASWPKFIHHVSQTCSFGEDDG